ncbi:hypothetical protein J4444_02020 [Candidatus Woesearchaeota archaeon]|nr:hypothetical protein [Candidatus Woesearchaeota archaeon]
MNVKTDDWNEEFKQWKEQRDRERQSSLIEKAEETVEESIKNAIGEAKEIEEKTYYYLKEPKRIRVLRIITLLIPIMIIIYLFYFNVIATQEFNYFYDIGSKGEKYLAPAFRISDLVEGNINYRNLTGHLVYFDVPIVRGSENINVLIKFKDNFPEKYSLSLGAKDKEEWHYGYHVIYNPALDGLLNINKQDKVYAVNPNVAILTLEELKYERNIIVASDSQYKSLPNRILDYKQEETIINNSLRGGHIAYIYISGDLNLNVKKQDINWYEGSDELKISVYDTENNLIANTTIADDGITNVSKNKTAIQEGALQTKNLKEGVYKIEFSDFDGLIREIKINTNKIVFTKLFLADNAIYNVETKPSLVYIKNIRKGQLEMLTYHKEGIQNISYFEHGKNQIFNFYQDDTPLYMNLSGGEHIFNILENDIILSGTLYFSFSNESYFEPFKQRVIPIKNDFDWLKDNVDYIVTSYKQPKQEDGWLVAETEFDINKEQLFVKDNKLSMVFNTPHLSQEEFSNYTIPVDWIKITVYKPGVFEK